MDLTRIAAWASLGLSLPAAVVLARLVGRGTSRMWRVLYAIVAYGALLLIPIQAEATLELLGLLERMTLLGPAVVSAAVLWAARGSGLRPARGSPADPGEGWRGTGPRGGSPGSAWSDLPTYVKAAAAIIAAVYGFFALERLTGHPASWDGVMYHLPVAVHWLQEGSLRIAADAHYYYGIPANADLLGLLTLASGWEGLAEIWNLLPGLAAVVSAYLLARIIGAGTVGSAVAALTVAGLPVLLFQAFSAYVDLWVAAWLLTSLAFLARLASRWNRAAGSGGGLSGGGVACVAAAGVACGFAVGAKATAWPLALVLSAGFGAWALIARGRVSRKTLLLAAFVGAAALPSLFWFTRNFAFTGNPAYPLEISLFGHQLFAGTSPTRLSGMPVRSDISSRVLSRFVYPWFEGKESGYPFSPGSGLGPLFAALVVPGFLYTLWGTLRRWRGGTEVADRETRGGEILRSRLALAGMILALLLVWWFLLRPVLRFGLVPILLLCVLAAPFYDELHEVMASVLRPLLTAAVLVLALLSTLPPLQRLAHRVHHGEWGWNSYYHLPEEFRRIPPDATVVNYDLSKEGWNNLALFGPGLERRVVADWEVKEMVANGEDPWACGAYVIDRAPYELEAAEAGETTESTLRLVVETTAFHGDEEWRIWTVRCREGGA